MRCKKSFDKIICLLTFFLTGVVFAPIGFAQTLPDAASVGNAAATSHLVQQGDTYYQLSRLYQVPVDSLLRWNGPDLKIGTTIRLKPQSQTAKVGGSEPAQLTPPTQDAIENQAINAANGGVTQPATSVSSGNRVMVIPFDPALYFSDADNDIAWQSKIPKQKIRYIFQARLNALLQAPGYQCINVLNSSLPDSISEGSNIYQNLAYSYQDIKTSSLQPIAPPKEKGFKAWVKNTKEKVGMGKSAEPVGVAHDETKYYGVQVNDPNFFTAFNNSTGADFYLFINQFEIFTDFTNCIDRTTKNFVRNFRVHYTIYNAQGELLAGNKILIPYESNVNDINKITRDNLGKMASRIMADLPRPESAQTSEARK